MDSGLSPNTWGAQVNYDLWTDTVYPKDKIVIHYNGPAVNEPDEKKFLRAVESYHLNVKRWRGIAYGWAIGQSGTVYRLRGWNNYGAHAGDYDADNLSENKEGIPVFFCLGGDQVPTPEALKGFSELHKYLSADPKSVSNDLPVIGHRDVSSTACPGATLYGLIDTKWWKAVGNPVIGAAVATFDQALEFVIMHRDINTKYDLPTLEAIVRTYYTIAPEYGVRADLALAQACKETGYFRFGGDVKPSQWNFAGIGATGGVPGITFPSIATGVRAHLLRMRMYAVNDPAAYNEAVLVRPLPQTHWGKYPNIEDFNGVWAYPGASYGQSIINDYLIPMVATEVNPQTLEEQVADLDRRVTILEGR